MATTDYSSHGWSLIEKTRKNHRKLFLLVTRENVGHSKYDTKDMLSCGSILKIVVNREEQWINVQCKNPKGLGWLKVNISDTIHFLTSPPIDVTPYPHIREELVVLQEIYAALTSGVCVDARVVESQTTECAIDMQFVGATSTSELTMVQRETILEEVGRQNATKIVRTKEKRTPVARASRDILQEISDREASEDEDVDATHGPQESEYIVAVHELHPPEDRGYIWGMDKYVVQTHHIKRASLFTNQRGVDVTFAFKLFESIKVTKSPICTNITLRPMEFRRTSDDDEEEFKDVTFKTPDEFLSLYEKFKNIDRVKYVDMYEKRYGDDVAKKEGFCQNRFLERCRFEPIDGQHYCEACRIANHEVAAKRLDMDTYKSKYIQIIAHICMFKDDSKYILESERLNNEPIDLKKVSQISEMLEKGRELWDACGNPELEKGKKPSPTDLSKLKRFYRCLMGVFNKAAPTDLRSACRNCGDQTSIIFRSKEAFGSIVKVCKEYESGSLCFDAPELTIGSKMHGRQPKMTMNWWRAARYVSDKMAIKICGKLINGDVFFGRKDKQRHFDKTLQSMVNKKAAVTAVQFLLRSDKELTCKDCDIEKTKGEEMGKLIDNEWAKNWLKLYEKRIPITPKVLAKIPTCLQNMYIDIKIKCLDERLVSEPLTNYTFSYDVTSEGGKKVNVNGIDIDGFQSMEADSWKEGLFLIDQIQEFTIGKIMELVQLISTRLLANEKRSTLVLFIKENQRDSLYAQLTTSCNGLFRKVFHGQLLRHQSKIFEGVEIQNVQPFIIAILERGDASLSFKHVVPNKKLCLWYQETCKAKHGKFMDRYKQPKQAKVVMELVENLLLPSWRVCLYRMGYVAETLLRKGNSVTVVDTMADIKIFDVFFSCTTAFLKESSNVEIVDSDYTLEEVTDSDASMSEEEDMSEQDDSSTEEDFSRREKGKRKLRQRKSALTIETRSGKKRKGSTSLEQSVGLGGMHDLVESISVAPRMTSMHVVPQMSIGEGSTTPQVVLNKEPVNEREEMIEMQVQKSAVDVEPKSMHGEEASADGPRRLATIAEKECNPASVGMHGGEALAADAPTSATAEDKECMVVEDSNPASVSKT